MLTAPYQNRISSALCFSKKILLKVTQSSGAWPFLPLYRYLHNFMEGRTSTSCKWIMWSFTQCSRESNFLRPTWEGWHNYKCLGLNLATRHFLWTVSPSFLTIVNSTIIDLFLDGNLTNELDEIKKLDFEVFLIDSSMGLMTSVNLEKEEKDKFSKKIW